MPESDRETRFRAIFSDHYDAVRRSATRLVDTSDLDDVVAETFLVAWRRLEDVPADPRVWLLGVARKAAANRRRSRARQTTLAQRLGREPAAPALAASSGGESEPALAAFTTLHAVIGCSHAALRVRLHRARPRTRWDGGRAPIALAMLTVAALAVFAGLRVADRSALAALPIRAAVTARPGTAGSNPSPRALLLAAARRARAERATAPLGRPIRYERTMAAYLHTVGGAAPASVLAPETTESWAAPDGSGQIRHRAAAVIWPSAEDRQHWEAGGAPLGRSRTDQFAAIDPISRNRSSDPAVLARQVRAPTTGSPQDAVAWTMAAIRDIVNAQTASPALRGAALEVAARLPLTSFGPVRDQLGRPGYALGVDSAYSGARTRYEWIISRRGALLEYQQLLLEPARFVHGHLPLQIEFEIESVRAWVARVGSTPVSAASS